MTRIVDDWLRDPLMQEGRQLCKFSDFDKARQSEWEVLHSTTRLKLEGATYHFRMVAGSVSLSGNLDDSRQMWWAILSWHLDAFFLELKSAFDCLLQEMNARYQLGVRAANVRRVGSLKQAAQRKGLILAALADLEKAEGEEEFRKIVSYRNMLTHRRLAHIEERYVLSNRPAVESGYDDAKLCTPDGQTEPLVESCLTYLQFMISLIWKAWNTFKRELEHAHSEAH